MVCTKQQTYRRDKVCAACRPSARANNVKKINAARKGATGPLVEALSATEVSATPALGNAGASQLEVRAATRAPAPHCQLTCKDTRCPKKLAGIRCQTRRRLNGVPSCLGQLVGNRPGGGLMGGALGNHLKKQEKQRSKCLDVDFDTLIPSNFDPFHEEREELRAERDAVCRERRWVEERSRQLLEHRQGYSLAAAKANLKANPLDNVILRLLA